MDNTRFISSALCEKVSEIVPCEQDYAWLVMTDIRMQYRNNEVVQSVAKRTVANFGTEFDNEFVHFFKNVGMVSVLSDGRNAFW